MRPNMQTRKLFLLILVVAFAGCSAEPLSSRAKKPNDSQGSNDNNAQPTPTPTEVVPTPTPTPAPLPTRYPGLEVKAASVCDTPNKMERLGRGGTVTETTTYEYKLDSEKRITEIYEAAQSAVSSRSKRSRFEYSIVFPNLYTLVETSENNGSPSSRSYRYDERGRLIEEIGSNMSFKRRTLTYDDVAQTISEVIESTGSSVPFKNFYDLKNKTSIEGQSGTNPVSYMHFFIEQTMSPGGPVFSAGSLGTLNGIPSKCRDPVASLGTDRIDPSSCVKVDQDYFCHWQFGITKQHSQFRIRRTVDGPLVYHEPIPIAFAQDEVENDGTIRRSRELIYTYDADLRKTSMRTIRYPKGSPSTETATTYDYTSAGCIQSEKVDGILQKQITYPQTP